MGSRVLYESFHKVADKQTIMAHNVTFLLAHRFYARGGIAHLCYDHCDNNGRFVMRASNNAMVLFLLLTSGCFGSRDVPDRDSDGGDSSKSDSGASDRRNTGGNDARFDARITGGRYTDRSTCGNGIREEYEICDDFNLAGATCRSLMPGYSGSLRCEDDCQNYDTSRCYSNVYIDGNFCGNNIVEAGEICDGPDLGGASCETLMPGFTGALSCQMDCQNYDVSMCYESGGCGNNIAEVGEICDGPDLAGASCWSLMPGFVGTLRCQWDCQNYDTSRCYEDVDDGGV